MDETEHASLAAVPSSSPAVASQSHTDRKPTWAQQFSFDDGFDLNLAGTSALAAASQATGTSVSSRTDPASTSSPQPSRPLDNTPTATTSAPLATALSNRTDAAHIGQENKRLSASPASSNKALPQLPSISNTAMNSAVTNLKPRQSSSETQAAPIFPASASFATTVHARAPSSQDGTPTPKPPGTPQAYSHASPIVTAATPEQPPHVDPSTTPLAKYSRHQPSRSQSSGVLAWDRPQIKAARPISSADAYMKPMETLHSEGSSRPGTAMSHLSGSNWMHDGPSNRSSVGTTSTAPLGQMKRASVLSFQTANSAGFTSGDEARASDREDIADDTLAASPPGAIHMPSSLPHQTRPWLDQAYSGYGSSPDERPLPGGLPGSFWADAATQPSVSTVPVSTIRQKSQSTPVSAAAIDAATDTKPASPVANPPGAVAKAEPADRTSKDPAKDGANIRATRGVSTTNLESNLSPINTQGLAPASLNGPLSSTTIAAFSDETAQAMRRSPDALRGPQGPSPLPDTDAPPLPAKDVQPDASVPRHAAFKSPRDWTNASPNADTDSLPADNVIPPSLPSDAVQSQPTLVPDMLNAPTDHKPVSDYRKKPLADISPAQKAAGLAHLQAQARAAKQANMEMQHPPPTAPPAEAPPIPILERGRRKSNASLTANVALTQAAAPGLPSADLVDRPDTPSAKSGSAESSAPPDGEVEARAEWERRRMNRKNRNKQKEAVKTQKGRSDPFKGQLKPLQLVPADNLSTLTDRNDLSSSAYNAAMRANGDRNSVAFGDRTANALAPVAGDAPASRQTYSTQQLQRLQAREQRRSVGAFSAAMAAANVVSSGSDGPYPVFASPNSGPQKVGSRQYPGLMAQRSLVPPFELQHRPDGLPSGLIGPDGVRRSLNDPEVCLECMMRDEDMIDIRVVGEGVWERESDKDFEEALRLEAAEEAANGNGTHGPSGSSGHGDSISSHRDSRSSRKLRKRIGKGEPLTVDRLKLHTQMNPPASSFRWRTLQTFLAVQAKYIAMEQQRMRLEAEKKKRQNNDSISSRGSIMGLDSPALAQPSERGLSSPFAPTRDASAASRQSMIHTSVEDSGLTPQQKQEKERDIAAAQAARKKMTASATAQASTPPLGLPAYPTTPLQTRTPSQVLPARTDTDSEELLAGPAAKGGVLTTPSGSRRMPFGSAQAARAASVQDLRSAADASLSSSAAYPSSPSDSLMPPSRSFLGSSPTGTPPRLGVRSGASQLSLMHSGSMIDMHVAQEDCTEHRLNQTGFVPGTPLAVESPAALNRSFYGFPGDNDTSLPDAAAFERSRMVSGDGYMDPMEAGPRGLDLARDDSNKRKKKGFRGFLSKLTGSSGGLSRENSNGPAGGSISGSIASRNPSKRSQGSGSPRLRQNSFSADRSLDAASPALNGMLSKARRSTSSFFRNGVEPDPDSRTRPTLSSNNSIFQNPPGMASQNSLDLGPFQPASPPLHVVGSTTSRNMQQQQQQGFGSSSDVAKMRKASNPLMQKYLNSPSPQTQAPFVPNQGSTPPSSFGINGERLPVQNGRMSSFASMRDLRLSPLQTIPDGDHRVVEDETRKSVRSSGASIRKELPFMPSASNGVRNGSGDASSGAPEQQRPASNGTVAVQNSTVGSTDSVTRSPVLAPAIDGARHCAGEPEGIMSMQTSRGTSTFGGRQALPAINPDAGLGLHPDDASVSSTNPRRPPKNPRRPDGAPNSPSMVDINGGNDSLTPTTPRRDFPQRQDGYNDDVFRPPESPDQGKKARFRLPFGRKKRESTLADSKPTIVIGDGDSLDRTAEARSTSRTFLPGLRSRKSYSGLGVPKASFQMERQRVLSSPAHEGTGGHAPRSQSAFGMAPTQRFVSIDVPRRSMNVLRGGNNRLSAMDYGGEEVDDDDDDDEMEREPGYEAEFNRYAQEAMEDRRYLNTGSKGRDVSFGRKSLNLLRDGFKLPLRTVSGDQKKQR